MSTPEQLAASSAPSGTIASAPIHTPTTPALAPAASPDEQLAAGLSSLAAHWPSSVDLTGVMVQGRELLITGLEKVAKPSVASFTEMCDSNPKLAAVIAAPAIMGLCLVVLFFIISVVVLSIWTMSTIVVGVVVVVIGGLLSLLLKIILVTAATLPLAAMATGFFVATITLFKYITSPAATLLWTAVSPSATNGHQTTTTADAQTSGPASHNTSPSQTSSQMSNLVTTTRIAWESTVIIASFLKWTTTQLWFVGSRTYVEIRKNIEAVKMAQAQSNASTVASAPEDPSPLSPIEPNVSLTPPSSNNGDKTTIVQRPEHARARHDDEQ